MANFKMICKVFFKYVLFDGFTIGIVELILYLSNVQLTVLSAILQTLVIIFIIIMIVQTAITINHMLKIKQMATYHLNQHLPMTNH